MTREERRADERTDAVRRDEQVRFQFARAGDDAGRLVRVPRVHAGDGDAGAQRARREAGRQQPDEVGAQRHELRIAELDAADGTGGWSGSGLADGLARMLHRMITDDGARRRVLARFELAFEATRRPELRASYDEMGGRFRAEAARLLAAAGSAEPDRDAWALIAWMEGTAFYALAGAGATAAPSLAELRARLAGLLASMCADDPGAA